MESWNSRLSDGAKPLAPIHYYARLAQRLINGITAPTGEGRLFEVDMRLRPSGNQARSPPASKASAAISSRAPGPGSICR